ncbi:hypothetical protein PSH84_08570 [Pseudomonas beijingensis]|uniref:hypothetical protein n=1 Tax=Pseudomonas beijingensis TaxID=2954101 RepID=UPI002734BDB3|nr:hypothetical protein [Pseudomonas sp. FP830]WLI46910.1 hypothetical protein PSH84_08570 [Pseudomonas sp. FP830]
MEGLNLDRTAEMAQLSGHFLRDLAVFQKEKYFEAPAGKLLGKRARYQRLAAA